MFLQREYTMRINKETSVLNKNLTISTNDQGIDIIFRLIDCPYIKLSLKQNLYARIILLDPLGKQIDSDITSIVENRVIFKLTKNLMANIKCTGVYKLYIAIMDDKTNVNLLPPIKCTIEESEIEVRGLSVGLVNQSAIDNSLNTDYGNEIALFNADGSYNRTVWISGDMITTARMNKLEDAASVSRDEILNLKEQITELNEKNTLKVMIGTEYEPIIISNLNKGFYIISGYVQDFPNKNPYLLSDENYFMVTFSYGNYSKIIRCLSGEEDFVKYKYDKVLEVIYRNEQELVVCEQAEGYVRVTLDEYQYIELNEDREVILPKPDSFTEIKLYVDAKQSDKLTFDGVIWNEPLDLVLGEMNTIYLSYINDKWYGSTNSDKDASDSSTPNQEATTHTCRETLFPSNGEVQLTSAPIQDLTLYSDCTIKIPSELSGKNVTLNVINTNDLTLRFSQDAKYHTFNLKAGTMSMFNINIDSEDSRIIRLHCIEDIIGDGDTIVEKYSITRHLSNSTINNTSNLIEKNGSYNATISANSGYEIKSIVVTMGGTNVSSTVVNGNKISIPSVTGIVVITVTTNKIENGGELKDFPYADDLVEIAMTYWRNANNEYVDGQPWSQGITYRASNTPLSAYCEASMSSENSFWVSIKGRHYKAMDCSTLVGLCLRGYTYENGPYANETQFNAFRTDRNQTNPSVSWAFTVPREAANIGKYCYDNNWIVPLSTIGNSSNNYAGLKKGDIIFWAKKKSDGNYKEPDRFMKISHVAIVYGNSDTFNGRLSIVECTTVTPRNHTWQDGTTLNCGVRIKDLVNSKPDEVVLVARIQL